MESSQLFKRWNIILIDQSLVKTQSSLCPSSTMPACPMSPLYSTSSGKERKLLEIKRAFQQAKNQKFWRSFAKLQFPKMTKTPLGIEIGSGLRMDMGWTRKLFSISRPNFWTHNGNFLKFPKYPLFFQNPNYTLPRTEPELGAKWKFGIDLSISV